MPKYVTHPHVMVHLLLHATLSTSSPSLSSTSLLRTQTCCPRIQLSAKSHGRRAFLRNTPPAQVMSRKRIELNMILVKPQNQTFDDQDDFEEIGVKKLSYSQSFAHSAYDSAESSATLSDSDLEDEQLRAMLTSPLLMRSVQKREGKTSTNFSLKTIQEVLPNCCQLQPKFLLTCGSSCFAFASVIRAAWCKSQSLLSFFGELLLILCSTPTEDIKRYLCTFSCALRALVFRSFLSFLFFSFPALLSSLFISFLFFCDCKSLALST